MGCFQPFKHWHTESVDAAVRLGSSDFDRLDFLAAFNWMRSQTFKPSTIKSAFRKTGWVPYNPEIVLEQIRKHAPARETTPENTIPLVLHQTPHTAENVIKYGQWFTGLLDTQSFVIPKLIQKNLRQFVKGSIANGYSRYIAERDFEAIHKEAVTKRARKTLAGTVAQKGRWMSVDQIRKSLRTVEETAVQKATKALEWANRAEEIQQDKAHKAVKAMIRKHDYGLWKLIHDNLDRFLLVHSVGQDIHRIRSN